MTISRIQTRYGVFAIDGEADKKMAGALKSNTYPNEALITIARAFVNEKSIVVDIGAHIGTFALPVASLAGKVIAFEPSRAAAELLVRNARENNVNLELIEKALGSEGGTGTLVVRNASNAGANTLVAGGDIPVTTLDDEVMHADFIKMDVEGMELDVLHGGTRLIESAQPVVLFEVNLSQLRAHGTSPRALEQFFTERGYRLYFAIAHTGALAQVQSATLLSALIAPRAWLFFGESAPFDLLAVPQAYVLPLPHTSFMRAITHVIIHNIAIKYRRIGAFFRSIF